MLGRHSDNPSHTTQPRWAAACRLLLAVALCLTAVMAAGAAHAGPPPADRKAQAGQHYQVAVRLFGQGRYREAIDEFNKAIALSPEAIFYCNRAIALIKLNEIDDALDSLKICRDRYKGDKNDRDQIDAQVGALSVFVHHVRPKAMTITEDIATGSFSRKRLTPPIEESGWGTSVFGYLSVSVGVALLTSAATLDYLSADLRTSFIRQSQGGPGTSQARFDDLRNQLRTRQQIFGALTISGAALTLTGISLLVYHYVWEDSGDNSTALVIPTVAKDAASLQFQIHF